MNPNQLYYVEVYTVESILNETGSIKQGPFGIDDARIRADEVRAMPGTLATITEIEEFDKEL